MSKRIEKEVLKSPVTLDFLIDLGDRIEAGEANLRDIFEESEEPADRQRCSLAPPGTKSSRSCPKPNHRALSR